MKKVAFISDFFKDDLLGGGEINDSNLINHLQGFCDVKKHHSRTVKVDDLIDLDSIMIANFTMLNTEVADFIMQEKEYIIYEHDHKYVDTRDPSKFKNFEIPDSRIVNKAFYENAVCVVVLSSICEEIMNKTLPKVFTHNIGCSLWSEEIFNLLEENCANEKEHNLCIMRSSNPTKNYFKTTDFCSKNNLDYREILPSDQETFLKEMSKHQKLLFIPTVLETYSRLCAEAKMLNLDVMTNKNLIGFFSEEYSSLKGLELIECIKQKNEKALDFFRGMF